MSDENQEATQRAMAAWKEGLAEAYRKGFEAGLARAAEFAKGAVGGWRPKIADYILALRPEAESKPCCDQWKRAAGGDGCPKCEPEAESKEPGNG